VSLSQVAGELYSPIIILPALGFTLVILTVRQWVDAKLENENKKTQRTPSMILSFVLARKELDLKFSFACDFVVILVIGTAIKRVYSF
jgi:hypothetical protein